VNITVLAASGATGLELTRQALERGHVVTAIARNPNRVTVPDSDRLTRVAAGIDDIARVLPANTTVLSGLGIAKGEPPGVLTAGAKAVVQARPERIIWLGAFGTGASAAAAGPLTRTLVGVLLKSEMDDKTTADQTVLAAGGTVFHAGPLTTGPLSTTRRTFSLADVPRRLFPGRVSRATVAAAMLDEAENGAHGGGTVVPVER
jgi:putative NADH-flavin reductase